MFPASTLKSLLQDRALLLQKARDFFASRDVLEVDCCALVPHAPIDSNIDVIEAQATDTQEGYLHTSPEYAMKRLLTAGVGDIYYLGHVFRKGEIGSRHNPEFTMAEWYRAGLSCDELIQETCEFLFLFFDPLPTRKLSYRDAFSTFVGIDYSRVSIQELQKAAQIHQIELPPESSSWSRDLFLHLLLSHVIEPHLGQGELTILTDYPPNEAALARVAQKNGETVAERFEIYYQGIELTNGYHELGDAQELRRRFHEENQIRQSLGKKTYSLDEPFLASFEKGFPACCGVSVGFDRALMIRRKAKTLGEVLPFPWTSP